jgi:hypothetical protein
MFCPKCGTEFVEGVETCSDCGVPLEQEPPVQPEAQYVEWVTVLTGRRDSRIGLAESLLMDADIEFIVQGEAAQMAYAVEPMRICVRPQDVERATEVLKDLIEGDGA